MPWPRGATELAGAGRAAPRSDADDLCPSSSSSIMNGAVASSEPGCWLASPDRLVGADRLAPRTNDARSAGGATGSIARGAGEFEPALFPVSGSRRRDSGSHRAITRAVAQLLDDRDQMGGAHQPDRCCRSDVPRAPVAAFATGRCSSPTGIIGTRPRSRIAMNAGPAGDTIPRRRRSSFWRCWRRLRIPGSSCVQHIGSSSATGDRLASDRARVSAAVV